MFEGRFNVVTVCDWHVPFESPSALAAAFAFCAKVQPQIIIIHETHDFYSLSRFSKDPKRIDSLQEELDRVSAYLHILRRECPNSRMILLRSNHLDRLKRYLWNHAPALSSLRALKVEELLCLDDHMIEYMDAFIYKNFLFKHGDLVSVGAGMTARRELAREGMSGASGHTHRLGQIYKRNRSGEYTWIESGCLCDLEPEWINGTADWNQGVSLVSFAGSDRKTYQAFLLPIIDGEILGG